MRRVLSGLRALLVQRVSAVYMLLFIVFVLAHFIFAAPADYGAWRAWILGPAVSVASTVFFAALLAHAWVGVRDVVLDYVRPTSFRIAVLALLGVGLMAIAVWVVRILWAGHA